MELTQSEPFDRRGGPKARIAVLSGGTSGEHEVSLESGRAVIGALDRSAYDTAMRRMHNYMKESDVFQHDPEGAGDIHFKPGSSWLVFADMVGHACKWGRLSIIDTFIVPNKNFRNRQNVPYDVLLHYAKDARTLSAADTA